MHHVLGAGGGGEVCGGAPYILGSGPRCQSIFSETRGRPGHRVSFFHEFTEMVSVWTVLGVCMRRENTI